MRPSFGSRLALLAPLLATADASAHVFDPGLLDIRQLDERRYEVRLVPPRGGETGTAAGAVTPRFDPPCEGTPELASSDGGAAAWQVHCASGFALTLDGLAPARGEVMWRFTPLAGDAVSGMLRAGTSSLSWRDGDESRPAAARLLSFAALGARHIGGGIDHLLFVLGLVLLVRGTWRLVETVSAFTVAHGLTLGLAAAGRLRLPSPPVEAAIALSLLWLAIELTRDAAQRRRPTLAAFACGLLHGLGFAGALIARGVARSDLAVALLGFNLGVEAGQLLVVALVIVARQLAGALRLPTRLKRLPAYAIGGLGGALLFDRLAGFRQ